MTQNGFEIKFIGGPIDGHMEPYCTRPARLAADVVWLVRSTPSGLIDGTNLRLDGALATAALYQLEGQNGMPQYQYVGAISAHDVAEMMCNS
ncbi:MAG: hypothetical protein RIC12_00870 [Pirellulales bacterium]